MSGAIKKIARSKRSSHNDKNYNQFYRNAYNRAEARKNIMFGEMLAEAMTAKKSENKDEVVATSIEECNA